MAGRPDTRIIIIVIAVAALVAASALGYWAYSGHKKREFDKTILTLAADTGTRLRDALAIETAPPTADRGSFLRKLDGHAATLDRNLKTLRGSGSGSNLALTDAADDYLLTAREILKRQADSRRHRLLLQDSARALREHMRADNRSGAWVRQAVEAKNRVNTNYHAYVQASDALDLLLGTLRASQAKIAPYVAPDLLIADGVIDEARRRAREDKNHTAAEFERLQRIGASR
ncbi:MAG TPA: hypothetical protein VMN03_09115 [Burkholderiales bacterium]|nr:hypothetical protein [Burkholderiales bacterium]